MEIRNHEIIHEINRGPITTVYKARHLNLERFVLLKVLNPQWLLEKDLLERFRREAKICAQLQHPNIIKVYDFYIAPELVYISMEYIDAISLEEYIKKYHPIAPGKLIHFCKNIFSAINYAHQKGVIHRDIKPANILIDRNENVHITDFGLASFHDADHITLQGQITGTPAYLAPERVKGDQATRAGDLYSLGITLFEMISNISPFRKDNTAATLQSILTEKIPEIKRKDIPEWLVFLVKKLTDKNPLKREEYKNDFPQLFYNPPNLKLTKKTKGHFYRKKYIIFVPTIVGLLLLILFFKPEENESEQHYITPDTVILSSEIEQRGTSENDIEKTHIKNIVPVKKNNKIFKNKISKTGYLKSDSVMNNVKYGRILIRCSPWANVYIDGDSIDITPMSKAVKLKTGFHSLILTNPNYEKVTQRIEIKADKSDTLSFKLREAYGFLFIQVSPWAKIYINNTYMEDTPLQKPIVVQAGQNVIKLVNPQYKSINDTIFVPAGKRVEKQFTFAN